jgi:FixJ family two-component response regulator
MMDLCLERGCFSLDRGRSVAGAAHITVVDDDESVRESLRALLRSVGFEVAAFSSAEEFLASDCRSKTTCIILDLQMSGMSGLDLQRALVEHRSRPPIIFITAHGDERSRSQALESGAVDYLFKPFSEESLLGAVDVALGRTAKSA